MDTYQPIEDLILTGLQDVAPAMSLAVYLRGTPILRRAYGYLDPESRLHPTQNTTLFDLASVTKLFTTTAFLVQVSAGKVALDDPVVSVVPEFGAGGARDIEGGQDPHTLERQTATVSGKVDPAQVTFRHLLTHTAGLAPWRDLFLKLDMGKDHLARVQQALDLIGGYAFVDHIGASVNYSDLGLITLGSAVARIDGQPTLAQVIYSHVNAAITFNPPLATLCAPTEDDQRWRKRRIQGEVHDENAAALGGIAGHAGLFGTADQVAQLGLRWLFALKGKDSKLSEQVAKEATTTHHDDRGLGWIVKHNNDELFSCGDQFSVGSFGHTGFTGTSLWVDPLRELVVSLMTNRVYYGRDSMNILPFRRHIQEAIARWADSL